MKHPGRDLEQWRALAALGAGSAARALEELAGSPLMAGAPHAVRGPMEAGPWEVGAVVELEGALGGAVGLLFPSAARDELMRRMLGGPTPPQEQTDSVLREVGNVVASQAISAMANHLGAPILPSPPHLARSDAEAAFATVASQHSSDAEPLRFESILRDTTSGLRAILVFAPEL